MLDGADGAELVWRDQLMLDVPIDLMSDGKVFGQVVVEHELPVLDRLEQQAAAFGSSGDGIVVSAFAALRQRAVPGCSRQNASRSRRSDSVCFSFAAASNRSSFASGLSFSWAKAWRAAKCD